MVDASFMQTLWNMNPVCSGCELAEGKCSANSDNSQSNKTKMFWNISVICRDNVTYLTVFWSLYLLFSGYLTGGHVLRLFHGHMDECLAISTPDQGEEQRK